jgi:cyclophilin family peptidyl-prolyl cis-trans isomerase
MPEPIRAARPFSRLHALGAVGIVALALALGACRGAGTGAASSGAAGSRATASPVAGSPAGGGAVAGCPTSAPTAHQASSLLADAGTATVKTSMGSFSMELYGDKAPIATANFVALARCGFYDGITFHRVIAGFVIQAGDPQTRTRRGPFDELGTGGPGYGFAIEPPASGTYQRYVVAMANSSQPDSNGSQFFIDLVDLSQQLPPNYTIFGKVIDGTDVVDAIGQVPTNGEQGVPVNPVVIDSIAIAARGS